MNRNRNLGRLASLAVAILAVLAVTACGGGGSSGSSDGGGDLLQEIKDRGTIRVSTDSAYPPQSFLANDGTFKGFDIDVAEEIAKRMGVEVQWLTPSWDVITSGNWAGRWDISVGSMTVTPERSKVLDFSTPYYYAPASVAVHEDNTDITDVETDLDGKTIGVCAACTYEFYLDGTLNIPGDYDFVIDDPQIKTYDTDSSAIQDLALGDGVRLDAAMSSLPRSRRPKNPAPP